MTTSFKEFALHPALQTALDAMKFDTPTPVQAMAIPPALEGRDVIGSAQTGTGKTGAFCVPMLNYLMDNQTAHALVMLPTRELAAQVHVVARQMIGEQAKGPQGIKTALLIGGEPIGKQYAQLDRRPRLIVGTPGRINDHLRGNPDLVDRVSFVVLDEADRMLDMGFAPQIDSILSETALERQTLMFSATFPDSIVKFTKQYLNDPVRISIGRESKPGENIEQTSLHVAHEQKYDELLVQLEQREGSIVVFARTQHSAEKIADKLNRDEHKAEAIHGGLRQRQRDKVISLFRKGTVRILVATDVAARGLDVPHVGHVINYDLPQVAEDYIHRIGRTARAGAKGQAVSFISPSEKHLWRDIERILNPDAANSDVREGGRGGFKKTGKKPFAGKPFGKKKFGQSPFEGRNGERKPFKRREEGEDRPFRGGAARKPKWNPDGDFARSDRPRHDRAEGGFKKRDDNFAANPDAYKKTRFEGENKKPFKKKFFGENEGRGEGSSFKKPFVRGDRDGNRSERSGEGRPFRKEGVRREEGGFKKPFKTDGAKKKSFGAKGPRNDNRNEAGRTGGGAGGQFRKGSGARSEGPAQRSQKRRAN
ncbi:MAG: DEAD/DEAH box helicase [Micavibrio sp.]